MTDALIGHTGFVGGSIARARPFDALYNSANIDEIRGKRFDLIVCAGAPGEKWRANQHPREDWRTIRMMIEAVRQTKAERVVLISTVDVYANPRKVDETTLPTAAGLHWYGINRLSLETMLREQFGPALTILRLPALFGPGLKKNPLFDLIHRNRLSKVLPNAAYQWYPVDRLAADIDLTHGLPQVNLVSDAVPMSEIRDRLFPGLKIGRAAEDAPVYDVRTVYPEFRVEDVWPAMEAFVGHERSLLDIG